MQTTKAIDYLKKQFGVVEQKYGIRFVCGQPDMIDDETFKITLTGTVVEEQKEESMEDLFRTYAESVGLSPDDLGASFEVDGSYFTIVGFNRKATKRNILCEKEGEEGIYKLPSTLVCDRLYGSGW